MDRVEDASSRTAGPRTYSGRRGRAKRPGTRARCPSPREGLFLPQRSPSHDPRPTKDNGSEEEETRCGTNSSATGTGSRACSGRVPARSRWRSPTPADRPQFDRFFGDEVVYLVGRLRLRRRDGRGRAGHAPARLDAVGVRAARRATSRIAWAARSVRRVETGPVEERPRRRWARDEGHRRAGAVQVPRGRGRRHRLRHPRRRDPARLRPAARLQRPPRALPPRAGRRPRGRGLRVGDAARSASRSRRAAPAAATW